MACCKAELQTGPVNRYENETDLRPMLSAMRQGTFEPIVPESRRLTTDEPWPKTQLMIHSAPANPDSMETYSREIDHRHSTFVQLDAV